MRAGWNATRRNRNLGTAKRGRGQDNRLVIPIGWPDDRLFYEVLRQPVSIRRVVGGRALEFLVEPTTAGFVHACTVDDVAAVLGLVPRDDVRLLDYVVLRQPTRKQATLASVWGRLVYWAGFARRPGGPAILLEATELGQPLRWSRSLAPDAAAELARLRADGHAFTEDRRGFAALLTLQAVRATQLYRTTLHELGHLVHRHASDSALYHTKPDREREAFAHRYADETRSRLQVAGRIPFPRRFVRAKLRAEGLDPRWFDPDG
jgi:hypothetical protein